MDTIDASSTITVDSENEMRNTMMMNQHIRELDAKLVECKQMLQSRNDEVNMLKDELDRKDNEFRDIHNKLRDVQHDNSTLKANEFRLELENSKLVREKKVLEDTVSNLEHNLNRKNTEIVSVSTKLNNRIQDMECEQVILKIDSSEKTDSVRAANDQLILYKEKNDEYLSQLSKLEHEMISQKSSFLKEMDDMAVVTDRYKNQADEFHDMMVSLKETDRERETSFNNEVNRLYEELQGRLDESERYFQQLLQEKDKEIKSLQDNYANNSKSSIAMIDDDYADDDINFPSENDNLIAQFKATRKELLAERLKSRELDSFLKSMEQEREMYKPIIENQNKTYEQMKEAHVYLQQKMQEIISINSNLAIDLRHSRRLLEEESEKVKALNTMKVDLSTQIKHLLRHTQGHSNGPQEVTSARGAQDYIQSSLVTFNDIEDLQNKNMQLLGVLRAFASHEGSPGDMLLEDGTVELGILSDKQMFFEELMKQRQARKKAEDIIEDLNQQIHYYSSILHSDVGGTMALTSAKKLIGDVHHQSPTPSKVSALKAKLHEAEQEVIELKEHVAQQDSDINTYKTKLAASQADLTKCQISNAQLTSECRTSRNELDRLVRNIKSFENEISDSRRKRADSEKAMIDQKHSIEKATIVSQELQEKIGVLEKKLHSLQIELSVTKESEVNLIDILHKKVDEMQRQDLLIQSTQRIEISLSKKWEEEKSRLINDNQVANKTIEQLRNDIVDRKLMYEQHQRALQEDVTSSRSRMQESNVEIMKLREALITEKGRSKEAEDHNLTLEGQLKAATSRLRVLEGSVVCDPFTESSSMERDLETDRLKLDVESMKTLISVLESNLSKSQTISSINEASVTNLKQEMTSMKAKHDEEIQRNQNELTIALQNVSTLQEKCDSMSRQKDALSERLAQTCVEYDNKVASLKEEILKELAKNNESGVNIELLKMEVLRFQKAAKAANTNYENELELRKQCQVQIKLLESEIASNDGVHTTTTYANSSNEIAELKGQVENLRKLNDVLLTKNQYMEAQMDRLGGGAVSGGAVEMSDDDMDLVRKAADDSREVIRHMQRERDALMLTISNMENENARLSGLILSSNRCLDEARSDLKHEIDKPIMMRKKEEFELLMLEVNQLNKVREINLKLKNENDDLRQKSDGLLVDLQTATNALNPLKAQIRELNLQKQLFEKEKDSLQKDLQLWSDRHTQLVARYSEVDPIEYRNLKQSADDLKKNLKAYQQKLDVSNKENGELKSSLTQKESELTDVQKELENERGRTSKLSEKMRDWKTKISDQQREKVELTTKNDELIKEMVSLKDTNQSLSEQNKESSRLMQEKDSQITMMQKQQLENEKERERERKGSIVELTKKRKDMGPEVIDEGGKDLEKSLKQQLKEKLKSKIIENTGNDAEVEEQPDIKKMKSSSTLVSRNTLLEPVGPFGQSPLLSKSILNPTASSFMPSDLGQLFTIPKGNTTTTKTIKSKEEGEESE